MNIISLTQGKLFALMLAFSQGTPPPPSSFLHPFFNVSSEAELMKTRREIPFPQYPFLYPIKGHKKEKMIFDPIQ